MRTGTVVRECHKNDWVILLWHAISDMKYCLLGASIHFTVNAGNSFDLGYRLFVGAVCACAAGGGASVSSEPANSVLSFLVTQVG